MKKIMISLLAGILGFFIAFCIALSYRHGAEFTKEYFLDIWKLLLETLNFSR